MCTCKWIRRVALAHLWLQSICLCYRVSNSLQSCPTYTELFTNRIRNKMYLDKKQFLFRVTSYCSISINYYYNRLSTCLGKRKTLLITYFIYWHTKFKIIISHVWSIMSTLSEQYIAFHSATYTCTIDIEYLCTYIHTRTLHFENLNTF